MSTWKDHSIQNKIKWNQFLKIFSKVFLAETIIRALSYVSMALILNWSISFNSFKCTNCFLLVEKTEHALSWKSLTESEKIPGPGWPWPWTVEGPWTCSQWNIWSSNYTCKYCFSGCDQSKWMKKSFVFWITYSARVVNNSSYKMDSLWK